MTTLTIGSRSSPLALWQANHIATQLAAAWPGVECRIEQFSTAGDRSIDRPLPEIGGKGLFTAELEEALGAGAIDLAVHSLKDLPVDDPPDLTLGAMMGRGDVRDALVTADGRALAELASASVVGTSSLRRRAQLLAARPDLEVRPIRGNVETRINKVVRGDYDATVLAVAGLSRLGLERYTRQILPLAVMLPAPGQGALAVQCSSADARTRRLLAAIENASVRACVTAERAFLSALGGGCSTPVAAYARAGEDGLRLRGLVAAPDGSRVIRLELRGSTPVALGEEMARQALEQGARELLNHAG
jgi:hydroxymethylbilane synthase